MARLSDCPVDCALDARTLRAPHMTSKCFGHAKINGRQTTSYASSRGEHTRHTSSAASRGHNKHCHHTGRTFCVLWRAHRSPGTLKRRGWTLAFARFESSKRACTTCGNRCGHCAASEPASCQFVGAQRTSSTTWDESTPCTSTQRSRKGDAQLWAGPNRKLGSYLSTPDTTPLRLRDALCPSPSASASKLHCSAQATPSTFELGTRVRSWRIGTDNSLLVPTSLMSSTVTRRSSVCRRHDCSASRSRSWASSGMVPSASRGLASRREFDKRIVTQRELPKRRGGEGKTTRQTRISGSASSAACASSSKTQTIACSICRWRCGNKNMPHARQTGTSEQGVAIPPGQLLKALMQGVSLNLWIEGQRQTQLRPHTWRWNSLQQDASIWWSPSLKLACLGQFVKTI